MSASTYSVDLMPAEQELLEEIELDALALPDDYLAVRRNGEFAARLMRLLIAREAPIPAHRLNYFTDPDYNIGGRGSSRQEIFERNGTPREAIFQHPHFLKYLRYFIHGPDLPQSILDTFQRAADECGQITSGDILPLAKLARQLARSHGLNPKSAAEEFYKLALEQGMGLSTAATVRNQVRTMR